MYQEYSGAVKKDDNSLKENSSDTPSFSYETFRRSKEELPIFTKQKMLINFPEDITHLTVSNNWLVCLMSHKVLLRIYLKRPTIQNEVFLEKYTGGYNISKIFFDPSGNHLLISLTPKSTGMLPELLYLHTKNNKPKRIDKFKNYEITAVAFNYLEGKEISTGPILLGTNKGLIFETEFGIDGEKLYQNNWKQLPNYIPIYGIREIEGLVFDLGRENPTIITGLNFFRVPNTNRFIVFATTLDNIYQFQEDLKTDERLSLQNIFNSYHNTPSDKLVYKHIIDNDLKYSKLRFTCDMTKKYPTQFVWLNKSGILYGEIHQNANTANFILNEKIFPIPKYSKQLQNDQNNSNDSNEIYNNPKTLILTDFHALLLYSDHITAVNIINKTVIHEDYFANQYGKLINIVKDDLTSSIYIYTSKKLFHYNVTNEKRNIWKIFLDKKDYVKAEYYSKDNAEQSDIVLCQKAENKFIEKEYEESALIYSETNKSFENLSLKFLELDNKKPLIIFLNNRLQQLSPDDKIQITMLIVWIIELYLKEIAKFNNNIEMREQLQNDFDIFKIQPRVEECIECNRKVIYDLMASHGDNHNLTKLTTVHKDYESAINQFINQCEFNEALNIIRIKNKPELYYKYCPILMEEIPQETITAIKKQGVRLDINKLIPTIICLQSENHINWIINYLEYAIITNEEKSIHNFLIKLYAEHRQHKLQFYLESQGRDITSIPYEIYYALRVCEQHNVKKACVFLQCLLELWQSAVELALTFDSKLAEETASQPKDAETKRKLWLKIAEHEIKGKNDVKRALELLKECDILKIEDLLPFFSDFEKIDDFKEAICDALKEYNYKNQEQQRDMEDSCKSADRVRASLQSFRNRHVVIKADEICSICEKNLMKSPFFIFPCGHKFHGDCLEKQIIPFLNIEENIRLNNLKQQLETTLTLDDSSIQKAQTLNTREQIKMAIEKILASDCLYCGIMIDSIDKPFIEDWDQINDDWQ